jgi:hypothetical protein
MNPKEAIMTLDRETSTGGSPGLLESFERDFVVISVGRLPDRLQLC